MPHCWCHHHSWPVLRFSKLSKDPILCSPPQPYPKRAVQDSTSPVRPTWRPSRFEAFLKWRLSPRLKWCIQVLLASIAGISHLQASASGLTSLLLSLTGAAQKPQLEVNLAETCIVTLCHLSVCKLQYITFWDKYLKHLIPRFKCEDGEIGGQYSKRVKKEVVSGSSEWRSNSDSNNNSDNNPTYYGIDHLHLHQHNV